MVLGECFILFTSFLFLKDLVPTNIFALNTVILSFAYLTTYSLWFNLFNIASIKNQTSTSRIGSLVWGANTYLLLSLCLVICSFVFKWDLTTVIWSQSAALLLLLFFVVISNVSGTAVSDSMQKHEERKLSLQQIEDNLSTLEINIKCNPGMSQRIIQIDSIKGQLQYITHSNNPKAKEIELSILNTIIEMGTIPNSTIQDSKRWNMAVEKCFTLISLRNQQL